MLILPMARKPLFPQVAKNLVIKDPRVISSVQNLMSSGQPYFGAFLTKDEENEFDVVKNIDEIHRIGSFCQILRADIAEDNSMHATVMPHRRIRITDLISPAASNSSKSSGGDDQSTVASLENTNDETNILNQDGAKASYEVMKDENVTRGVATNIYDEPCNPKNPVVKAITTEILSVIKDIIRYNPAVREQVAVMSLCLVIV